MIPRAGLLLVSLKLADEHSSCHAERMLHTKKTFSMTITALAELTKGSKTLPTDSTNLWVTMQHESRTALIWRDVSFKLGANA